MIGEALIGLGGAFQDIGRERRAAAQKALDREYEREWFKERLGLQEDIQIGRENRAEGRAAATRKNISNVYQSLFGTESGGNFGAANDEGYMGRAQFGQARLDEWSKSTGAPRVTVEKFRNNPDLQKEVEKWHFADINEFIDDNELMKYDGQSIGGVKISRSGMIAMAHLGGSDGMKKFLTSGGKYNPSDSNGTSLSDYAQTHGGLSTDMSGVWDVIADERVPAGIRTELFNRATQTGKDKGIVPGDPKSLPQGLRTELRERWDVMGLPEEYYDAYESEVEKFYGGGATTAQILQHFNNPEIYSRGPETTTTKRGGFMGLGRPREVSVPGDYTGGINHNPSQPAPMPGFASAKPAAPSPAPAQPATPATPATPNVTVGASAYGGPPVGTVRNGYRFKGGNPNDQANWVRIQ